ncbi:hypothetical protein HYH96_02435 [Clostridium botulinum]|uniref:hypothetical protein n=1 Tax=Clostridium botulinum TaxID=1491 RepID=UPI00174B6853|nr:hypothetical protein [Clostridium botulinum]MBD5642753.1 hypothetical protein [Clostridium botulinum]
MKVGKIIETQQPNAHKQLNKNKKCRSCEQEKNLSFSDVAELMQHDSYCRGRGERIKQRTWGK